MQYCDLSSMISGILEWFNYRLAFMAGLCIGYGMRELSPDRPSEESGVRGVQFSRYFYPLNI
jgi:hypothetical protein